MPQAPMPMFPSSINPTNIAPTNQNNNGPINMMPSDNFGPPMNSSLLPPMSMTATPSIDKAQTLDKIPSIDKKQMVGMYDDLLMQTRPKPTNAPITNVQPVNPKGPVIVVADPPPFYSADAMTMGSMQQLSYMPQTTSASTNFSYQQHQNFQQQQQLPTQPTFSSQPTFPSVLTGQGKRATENFNGGFVQQQNVERSLDFAPPERPGAPSPADPIDLLQQAQNFLQGTETVVAPTPQMNFSQSKTHVVSYPNIIDLNLWRNNFEKIALQDDQFVRACFQTVANGVDTLTEDILDSFVVDKIVSHYEFVQTPVLAKNASRTPIVACPTCGHVMDALTLVENLNDGRVYKGSSLDQIEKKIIIGKCVCIREGCGAWLTEAKVVSGWKNGACIFGGTLYGSTEATTETEDITLYKKPPTSVMQKNMILRDPTDALTGLEFLKTNENLQNKTSPQQNTTPSVESEVPLVSSEIKEGETNDAQIKETTAETTATNSASTANDSIKYVTSKETIKAPAVSEVPKTTVKESDFQFFRSEMVTDDFIDQVISCHSKDEKKFVTCFAEKGSVFRNTIGLESPNRMGQIFQRPVQENVVISFVANSISPSVSVSPSVASSPSTTFLSTANGAKYVDGWDTTKIVTILREDQYLAKRPKPLSMKDLSTKFSTWLPLLLMSNAVNVATQITGIDCLEETGRNVYWRESQTCELRKMNNCKHLANWQLCISLFKYATDLERAVCSLDVFQKDKKTVVFTLEIDVTSLTFYQIANAFRQDESRKHLWMTFPKQYAPIQCAIFTLQQTEMTHDVSVKFYRALKQSGKRVSSVSESFSNTEDCQKWCDERGIAYAIILDDSICPDAMSVYDFKATVHDRNTLQHHTSTFLDISTFVK
jgi:hypothetical protein